MRPDQKFLDWLQSEITIIHAVPLLDDDRIQSVLSFSVNSRTVGCYIFSPKMTSFKEKHICCKFCFKLGKTATETYNLLLQNKQSAELTHTSGFQNSRWNDFYRRQ
jgi:hypothetical protein